MDIEIRPEDLTSQTASSLIAELNAELLARYPNPLDCHYRLEQSEVAPGRGVFVVAWMGQLSIACGAVRMIQDDVAELKRMYVTPPHRGRGIAGNVLSRLETEARSLGATTVVLETGVHSREAIAFYRRANYGQIPKFGPYVQSNVSFCMGKILTSDEPQPSNPRADTGIALLDEITDRSGPQLDDDEAMTLAVAEIRASRDERRQARLAAVAEVTDADGVAGVPYR